MSVFRMFNGVVMDQHGQNNEAEYAENTQHNNHIYRSLSTASIKNNKMKNKKTVQNKTFCSNVSFAKNSPAKYPARMILAKSPIKPAINSRDFDVNHCIHHLAKTLTYMEYVVNILALNMINERQVFMLSEPVRFASQSETDGGVEAQGQSRDFSFVSVRRLNEAGRAQNVVQ